MASKLRPKKYRGCHREEDTIPAFVEFYCMNRYIGIYHTIWWVLYGGNKHEAWGAQRWGTNSLGSTSWLGCIHILSPSLPRTAFGRLLPGDRLRLKKPRNWFQIWEIFSHHTSLSRLLPFHVNFTAPISSHSPPSLCIRIPRELKKEK